MVEIFVFVFCVEAGVGCQLFWRVRVAIFTLSAINHHALGTYIRFSLA